MHPKLIRYIYLRNEISMKLFYLALRSAFLSTCYLVLVSFAPVMAADSVTQETSTYQSSFDDYNPLSDDSLSDWKSINVPSNGGGHAGHSMAGMQHKMSPEQMANMPSDSKEMSGMEGMNHGSMEGMKKMSPDNMKGMDHSQMKHDHAMAPMVEMDHSKMAGMEHKMSPEQMADMPSDSKEMPGMKGMDHSSMEDMKKMSPDNMKGMDHSQMKHDHAVAPMAEMDHSKMVGMNQDNMKSMSDSKSAMQPMKKEAMPEMSHDEMAGHDHGGSDMKAMDHSKMSESKANDTQPSHEGAVQDESQPHEHISTQESKHAGMSMPSMAAPSTQITPWQIVPNLHPVVVHFPIALTVIAFLLSIAAYARRSHPVSTQLAAAGHFTLWLAAIGAAAAVLFGWFAFNSVNHDDAGHAAMLLHRSWAIPTALGLILLASWDAWKYRVNVLMSVPMLFLLFLLSQAIAVTGWLGGEVVYRHGIGVLSIPATEGAGHGHHKGAVTPKAGPDEHTEMNSNEKGESHEH